MSALQPHLRVGLSAAPAAPADPAVPAGPAVPIGPAVPGAEPSPVAPESVAGDAGESSDAGHGLRLAVSQQAELLALLAGSVRADRGPADGLVAGLRPLDTVRLADVVCTGETPGAQPLVAFGVAAPQLADDADRVVDKLGGRDRAA